MAYTIDCLQQFVNLNIGEGENAAKRVDALYINAFGTDILRTIGKTTAAGDDAVDAGSGVGICIISVRTDSARIGVVRAGDKLRIVSLAPAAEWNGTAAIDDVISFQTAAGADAQLYSGIAPADYSNAAFIDQLRIFLDPQGQAGSVHFDDINLDEASVGGVHLGRFNRPGGLNAETTLAALEVAYDAGHNPATGAHDAEVITNANLNIDSLLDESFESIIDGDFEEVEGSEGVVRGWGRYNPGGATYVLVAAPVSRGVYAQQVVATGIGQGINAVLDARLYQPTDYANRRITFGLHINAANNDSVVLQINDGVGVTTLTPAYTAGAYEWIWISRVIDAAPTTIELRAYTNIVQTFEIDGAVVFTGRVHHHYANAPLAVIDRVFSRVDEENYAPNGDNKCWTNPAVLGIQYPDFWQLSAGAPTVALNAINRYGVASMHITGIMGDAVVGMLCFNPNAFAGQDCYVSFWHYGVGGATRATVTATDGAGGTVTTNIAPQIGAWNRCGMWLQVTNLPVAITLTIQMLAAGQILIDGVTFTRGYIPVGFKPANYLPLERTFVNVGVCGGTNMTHHGSVLDVFCVDAPTIVHKIYVTGTLPVGGTDVFTVTQNGAPTAVAVNFAAGGANPNSFHLPAGVAFAAGDRLQVAITPGMGPVSADVGVTVGGLQLGY